MWFLIHLFCLHGHLGQVVVDGRDQAEPWRDKLDGLEVGRHGEVAKTRRTRLAVHGMRSLSDARRLLGRKLAPNGLLQRLPVDLLEVTAVRLLH